MEIIIGRDPETSQLLFSGQGKSKRVGAAGSVPHSVSRQHCKLSVGTDGIITLTNLNPANRTFVNGVPVESKRITTDDRVELGAERFPIDLSQLGLPRVADIRPLQQVWEEFDGQKTAQQVADRKFNALSRVTGLITMCAIALTMFTGARTTLYIVAYVLAIAISAALAVKAYIDSRKVPEKNKKATAEFQRHYVCPCCHWFLGFTDYSVLRQNGSCPHCKARFKA